MDKTIACLTLQLEIICKCTTQYQLKYYSHSKHFVPVNSRTKPMPKKVQTKWHIIKPTKRIFGSFAFWNVWPFMQKYKRFPRQHQKLAAVEDSLSVLKSSQPRNSSMNPLWNSVSRDIMAGILSSCGNIVHLKCHVPGTCMPERRELQLQIIVNQPIPALNKKKCKKHIHHYSFSLSRAFYLSESRTRNNHYSCGIKETASIKCIRGCISSFCCFYCFIR